MSSRQWQINEPSGLPFPLGSQSLITEGGFASRNLSRGPAAEPARKAWWGGMAYGEDLRG